MCFEAHQLPSRSTARPTFQSSASVDLVEASGEPNYGRELLQEIRHPFHPRHCLTLVDIDNDDDEEEEEEMGESSECSACCFHVDGFRYRCDECKINLHPECTSLKPNIKYTGHDHLLILVENLSYETECEA